MYHVIPLFWMPSLGLPLLDSFSMPSLGSFCMPLLGSLCSWLSETVNFLNYIIATL